MRAAALRESSDHNQVGGRFFHGSCRDTEWRCHGSHRPAVISPHTCVRAFTSSSTEACIVANSKRGAQHLADVLRLGVDHAPCGTQHWPAGSFWTVSTPRRSALAWELVRPSATSMGKPEALTPRKEAILSNVALTWSVKSCGPIEARTPKIHKCFYVRLFGVREFRVAVRARHRASRPDVGDWGTPYDEGQG